MGRRRPRQRRSLARRISPHPHRGHGAAAAPHRDAARRGPAAGHRSGDDSLDLLDHAPERPARPRRPGRHPGAAADLPGLDLAAQGNATALSRYYSTRQPAACLRGTRSPAQCLARSSPPPCGQTGSGEQPGGSNRHWGAAEFPTTSVAGSEDQAEQSKLRNSRASAFMPSGIGPTRALAPRGAARPATAAATSASAAGAGLPPRFHRYRSAFCRPAAGWPRPATRPGSGPCRSVAAPGPRTANDEVAGTEA